MGENYTLSESSANLDHTEWTYNREQLQEYFAFPESVDITVFSLSKTGQTLQEAQEITIGDCHGSTLKILEILINSEVVDMPLYLDLEDSDLIQDLQLYIEDQEFFESEQTEFSFKQLYFILSQLAEEFCSRKNSEFRYLNFDNFSQEKFNLMKRTRDKLMKFIEQIEVSDPDKSLRFVGDVIVDRGLNDELTIKLLQKLQEGLNEGNLSILAGNHDLELLYYLDPELFHDFALMQDRSFSLSMLLHQDYDEIDESYNKQDIRGKSRYLDKQRILDIFQGNLGYFNQKELFKWYLNKLDLIDFDKEKRVMYSHTSLYIDHMRFLLKQFDELGLKAGLPEEHSDLSEIKITPELVNAANEWLQEMIKLALDEEDSNIKLDQGAQEIEYLRDMVWVRFLTPKEEEIRYTKDHIPADNLNFFIHGHYPSKPKKKGETVLISLDDNYRKDKEFGPDQGVKSLLNLVIK